MSRNFHSKGRSSSGRRSQGPRSRRQPQTKKGPKKEYIDPSRFVKAAKPVEQAVFDPQHRFEDFSLVPMLANKLKSRSIHIPTPIQDQVIAPAIAGKSIVGIADTGTGKTLAFVLPMLHKLYLQRSSRAIILAPTRDLAIQVLEEAKSVMKQDTIRTATLIGGASMGRQIRDLNRRPALVVGTPGRIKDHIERGTLNVSKFDTVVLDEVDRMLDMGFVKDVSLILGKIKSPDLQSYFFSATMDVRVRKIINEISKDPVVIEVKRAETSDNVEQDVVRYNHSEEKIDKLHDVLINEKTSKVIIFDDTRREVERLSSALHQRGFKVDSIHGGKSQGQRKRALENIKNNQVNVLVATDVAARGIDINDISHVINYSQPNTYSDYVHRIGRAGRANKTGAALTFVRSR